MLLLPLPEQAIWVQQVLEDTQAVVASLVRLLPMVQLVLQVFQDHRVPQDLVPQAHKVYPVHRATPAMLVVVDWATLDRLDHKV